MSEICTGCVKSVFGQDWLHVGSGLISDGRLVNTIPDLSDPIPTMALMSREDCLWVLFEPKLPRHATLPLMPLVPKELPSTLGWDGLNSIYCEMRQALKHAVAIGVLARDSSGLWHYAEDESKTDVPEGTVFQ